MSNPYDAFDAPTQPPAKPVAQANPYDQFYAPTSTPAIGAAPNPYDVFDSPDKAIEYASANYHDPATQDAAFEAYKQKSKTPITVGSAAKATGQFLKAAIPTKDDQGEWQWPLVSGAWQMAKGAAQTAKNIGETQGTSPKTRIFSIIPGIGPFAAATAAAWNEDPSAERAGRQLGVGAESGALAAARMVAHARQNLSGLASAITGGNIGTQAGDLSDADLRKRFNDEVEAHYLQSQMAQGRYASEAEGGPDVMRTPEELAAKGAPINPEEIQGIASTTNPTNLAELGALTNPLAKGVMAPLVRAGAATAETAGNLVGKIPRSLSPLAAVASAFHGNPLGNAVAEGIAGAAATKAAPAVGSAVGSFLRDNAAQMAGEAPRVGQSAIRKVANAGFQGAAGGVPVGAAFALGGENSEEMGQQFFGAIGLGGILSATSAAPRAGKAGAIEQAAVARQLSREGAAANFGVGYDAFHQDAMKSVSPQEAELINKYRGFVSRLRAPDGKPIQIYAVTGDKFGAIQKQMGEVDAQGNPTNPNGRGLITPDGSQLFINVHSQGNLNAPLAHETGHAAEVASQFANQILKQSLSATIAEHLYGPNGLPTPDFMQFIDQYSKAVGAAKARSMTDRDFQSEFIAETARHLLSGGNIEQYALPKGMMDGVQDWIQNKLGIKPDAGKLGFDGTEVSAITKKVGEMLRSVGTTKPTDTSAQFRIDQLKQIIDQPPGKAATIEQLDQYAAAKKEYDDLLKKQATANPSAAFPAAGAPPVAPSAPKTPADIQRFNDAKAALVALGHKAGAAIAAIKEAEKQHGEPIDKTENLVKGAQRILQNLTVAPGQYKPGWVKPLAPIPPVDTTKTFNDPNGIPQKITGESTEPVKVGDHVLTEAGIVRKVVRIHPDGGLDVIAPNTSSTITTQPVKAGRFRVLTTETTTPQAAAAETPQNTVKPGPGGTFIIVDAAGNPINKRTYKTQASAERVAAGQGKANKFKLKPNPNPDVPDVIDAILEQGGVNLSGLSKEEAAVFIRDQYLRTLLSDPAGQPPDEIARLLAATEEGGQSFGDGDIRTLSDLIADAYRARQIGESPESAAEKAEKQARAEAAKQPVPPAQPTPNAPTEPPPSEPVPSPTVSTIERTPAPDAPAEPGALSRLQINETAKAAREAFLADKEPAKSGKNKGQHTKENQKAADRAAFQAVAEAYVATLPPNYEGIKLTESPLGFPEVSGTVKPGRAFDDYLLELAGVTPEQLQTIGDIQNRIGQTISVEYAHAAGKPGEPNYAATRRAAQKASPAKGRIERGEGQEETKVFLPQKLKFNFGSKTFTVLGTNVEKLLNNYGYAEEAMQQAGEEMPYRDIHDPKLVADLKGLQANHDAGFTWDGNPIQGLVDRPLATNRPSAKEAPYKGFLDEDGMPDLHRFEFLNMLLGNEGARTGKRGPTDIQKAKLTLGEMNRGDVSDPVTAEGETNQLRDRLNAAMGPQDVLDADYKPTGETDRWSKVFMEDPLDEAISIENITKINPEVERGSSPLHEHDYKGDLNRHFGKLKPGNTEQERIAAAGRFLPESRKSPKEMAQERIEKRKKEPIRFLPSDHDDAIKSAAIRMHDTGKIYTGHSHGGAMGNAEERYPGIWNENGPTFDEGFVTKKGRFLSREQASEHAKKIGQISERAAVGLNSKPEAMESSRFHAAAKFMPEDAKDIVPAIRVAGKIIKGQPNDTHQDILDRHMAENPDDVDALMDFDTKANPNFFVTKDGQEISREQLKERFGVSDSQGLRRIQGGGAKFMPEEGIGGYADPRFDIPEKQQERISGVAHRRVRRVFPDLNDETDAYRMKVERLITELSNEWAHQHPRPAQQPSARRGVLDADHIVRQITREEAKDLASEEGTWWLFSRMEDGSEGEVAPVAKPYVPKQEAIIMAIEQAKEYGEMKIGTFEKQSPTSEGFPLYRITDQDGTWFVTDPAGNNVNYASTRAEAERLVEAYNRRADALPQGELPEGYRLEQHGNAHVLYGPGLETGRTMRSATRAQALSEARQMASDAAAEHRETTRSSQEQAAPKKFTPTGDTEHDIGSLNSMTLSRLGDISQRAFKRRLREMIQAGEPPSLKLAERVLTDLQRESRSSMPRLPQPRGELSKKSPLADVHTDLDNKIVEQQADIEKEIKALTEQIDEYDAPQGNYENRIQRAELEELRRSFVEDHANLHSLRESLRLANPTTLDQFPRAFAEIRRLEVRGLISHEAKERAYETLSDRQNTEIARQIIAEEEARPQRDRQSRIDAKIRVAQREAAKTRTEQQTLWDDLLQAKDAKNLPKVAKLWQQVSRNDDAFSFPRAKGKTPEEIAKEISTDRSPVNTRTNIYGITFTTPNGALTIEEPNGHAQIGASGAGSRGKKQGGGSQLYQAAFAWAHNNGKVIHPSNALSTINAYVRRTSNMLSSALRFGTTRHMIPDKDQGVKNWQTPSGAKQQFQLRYKENSAMADKGEYYSNNVEGTPALFDTKEQAMMHARARKLGDMLEPFKTSTSSKTQDAADANNIAQLAIRERDQVLKAVPSLNTLDFDFKSGKIKDQNGKEITPTELGKLLEAEGKSKTYDKGIGLSTAQRAIITNSAMREAEAGTLAGPDRGRGNRLVKEQRSLLYLPASKEDGTLQKTESRAPKPRQQASSIKAAAQDRMKRRRELQTR